MTDADIRTMLLIYTQDAADAKDAVGARIAKKIEVESYQEKPHKLGYTWLRTAVLIIIAMSMFMTTSYGEALASFVYENVIQRFFIPIEDEIMIEGMPDLRTIYPYGEIIETDTEGLASYVIYLEDSYDIVQEDNLFRAVFKLPVWTEGDEQIYRESLAETGLSEAEIDALVEEARASFNSEQFKESFANLPPVYLEITQVAGVTVDEMVSRLQEEGRITSVSPQQESDAYAQLHFLAGSDAYSEVADYYVRDNTCGGVFVITAKYFFEAAEGHGARFASAVNTLEIIDYDDIKEAK